MNKVLALLVKYNVTESEMCAWIATALEYKADDDDCTERMDLLRDELNVISWNV